MSWRTRLGQLAAEFGEDVVQQASRVLARDATEAQARKTLERIVRTVPEGVGFAVPRPAAAKVQRDPSLVAAVRAGGKVYKGPTHLEALDAIPDAELRRAAALDAYNRGFVNDRGRFLDRYKAADYARNYGLLSPDAPAWAQTAPELIAEHLAVKKKRGGLAVKRKKRKTR